MPPAPDEWELRFKNALERALKSGAVSDIELQQVVLEGSYPDTNVVIIFRSPRRPGCEFGYRWNRLWDMVLEDRNGHLEPGEDPPDEEPEATATVVWANLDEDVNAGDGLGLPSDCVPDGIKWL